MEQDPVQAFRQLTPDQLLDSVEFGYLKERNLFANGSFLALNSYENRVYQIGVEDQAPIVAKFYRPARWTDEQILEEHQFTLNLAKAEIPVIPPQSDGQGRTLFHHGPFRFAIYACRGGRALELDNTEHLEQMGRFIGRIHAYGSGCPYVSRPGLAVTDYVQSPSAFLLENQFVPAHIEPAYTSLIAMLLTQIGHCFERAGKISSLSLHGDFHPGNVLWTDQGPHIVDFDDARSGPAIQDLWMFLSGDRHYMELMLPKLLRGYSQFYDFNPLELHLIEALRTMRLVHQAGWMAARWQDPAFPLAFPWFNSLSFWERHISDLREQSAAMSEMPLQWDRSI